MLFLGTNIDILFRKKIQGKNQYKTAESIQALPSTFNMFYKKEGNSFVLFHLLLLILFFF